MALSSSRFSNQWYSISIIKVNSRPNHTEPYITGKPEAFFQVTVPLQRPLIFFLWKRKFVISKGDIMAGSRALAQALLARHGGKSRLWVTDECRLPGTNIFSTRLASRVRQHPWSAPHSVWPSDKISISTLSGKQCILVWHCALSWHKMKMTHICFISYCEQFISACFIFRFILTS